MSRDRGDGARGRVEALECVAVVALAALPRLVGLGRHGLWQDEANSIVLARAPWNEFVSGLVAYPPFYFLALRPWLLAGRSEAWVRLPTALLGVALAGLAWAIGRELAGRRAGLLAGVLVAAAPVLVASSREARPYALLDVCLALAILGWLRAARTASTRDHALMAFGAVGALYAHYYAALSLMALAVSSLFGPFWRAGRRRKTVLAGVSVALAFLPWVGTFARQGTSLGSYAAEVAAFNTRGVSLPRSFAAALVGSDPAAALRSSPELLGLSGPWSLVAAGFVLLVLIGAWLALRNPAHRALIVLLVLLPPLVAMVLMRTHDLFVSMKYLTIVSFSLSLAAAAALARLRPPLAMAGIVALVGLQLPRLIDLQRRPVSQIREAVAFIQSRYRESDCVLSVYNRGFMVRLLAPAIGRVYDLPMDVPGLGRAVPRTPLAERAIRPEDLPAIESLAAGCSTAWLLVSEPQVWGVDMGSGRLRGYLASRGFRIKASARFLDAEIDGYVPPARMTPSPGS